MVSSRALIFLIAVCFQSASCARLKRGTAQRKLAQVALSNGGKQGVVALDQEPVVVSNELTEERDKIHGFLVEEEARLKLYELDLAKAEADLGHQKYNLKNADKIWKVWNWRVFSDKLKTIEAEIERLETKIQRLNDLINTVKGTIKDLKDAKQWAHDAAQSAMQHEKQIGTLQKQLQEVKQDHVETVQAYEVAEKQAKEDGEQKVRLFEIELTALSAEVAKQQAVLDSLNNGDHDLHSQMKTTRANMKETIEKHATKIKHLTAALLDNERQRKEAENVREQSKEQYEATLATLREGRNALEEEATSEGAQMEAAKQDLARQTKEGLAAIEDLKKQLQQQLKGLNADIRGRSAAVAKQKIENAAKLLALNAKYTYEVERKTQQLNGLIGAQEDSRNKLAALRKTHLAEASDNAVVSEALHKAKEDLEFKVKMQRDVKATALENIQRIKRTISVKKAELAHEDKLWKFWTWRIWSSVRTDLEKDIEDLRRNLRTEEGTMTTCAEFIDRLSTQISSKLSATQMAEVQEVAIDKLDIQIQGKQNELQQAVLDQQTERTLAKETGEDQVRTFEHMLQELKAQESTAKATLDQLGSGTHDMHKNLEDAKAAIKGIIETHEIAIKNLTAAITVSKNDENEIMAAETNDVAEHEKFIATLDGDKDRMSKHRQTAENDKKAAENTLADLEADHIKSTDELKTSLSTIVKDLKQSRADQKEDFFAQKLEEEKVLQMERKKRRVDIANLQGQMDELSDSKVAAAENLRALHEQLN